MADVIRKATNKFTKGLVMDFSPENTKNEVLTHALNATLLTFNGNELSLQNDMGNGRVETAFLPEGYMPVGTCEYGGIIYIVSYNPLEDKSQIGCFPSPERNVSSDELGLSDKHLRADMFQDFLYDSEGNPTFPTGDIKNTSQYVLLRNDNLNPGDKFLVHASPNIYNELLADLEKKPEGGEYELVNHPLIALNLVSIEDTGRIIYLNSDLRQYEAISGTGFNRYHILGENPKVGGLGEVDIDSYRNVLSSGYNVFKSKTSGKLALLAELVTIDSYSVTHSVIPKKIVLEGTDQTVDGSYDIIIHTDVEPYVTPSNYNTVPKLSYYYLKESQGWLQLSDTEGNLNLFTEDNFINQNFLRVSLDKVFTAIPPSDPNEEPLNLNVTLEDAGGKFYFHKSGTYHGRMEEHDDFIAETAETKVYTKFTEDQYHRVAKSQIIDASGINVKSYFKNDLQAKFYKYDPTKTGYTKVETETLNSAYTYYIKTTTYAYYDAERNANKYQDAGIPLYKITTQPEIADSTVIKDTTVEKFQESEVYTYNQATPEEIADYGKYTLYSKDGDSYTKLNGAPQPGVTYYTLTIDKPMISIGFSPSTEEYRGDIFYYPGTKTYVEATKEELDAYWDFDTYPLENSAPWGAPIMLYYKNPEDAYRLATEYEMVNFTKENITLYYKQDYILIEYSFGLHPDDEPVFVVVPMDAYVTSGNFVPDESLNYIKGCEKPEGEYDYPKDDPLVLCTVGNFIPTISEPEDEEPEVSQYTDLKLAGIKAPGILAANGLSLPFKYSYTVTPCMNYGKLDHLSVSNTVDFGNLHAFNQSNFTEWRYHIDGNQLRLTFGTEIFDTYEEFKVDGLILEFYDSWGFAGSFEINNKKSYSGIFTKLIQLDTLGGLSRNRVFNGQYTSDFVRNVNIQYVKDSDSFTFGGNPTTFNEQVGWSGISAESNDCGVLYSNLIYGVKSYIRRTVKDGKVEFIPGKDMVLFTLPIYNDYYYSISDFNSLDKPRLDMSLSYKLVDNSSKEVYTEDDKIFSGYSASDYSIIKAYSAGALSDTSLNVTKFYKYKGTTSLYVELGLHEKYNTVGLKYDTALNNYYEGSFRLISNSDSSKTYSIESNKYPSLTERSLLNYTDDLDFSNNYITLNNCDNKLENRGYLNIPGNDPMEIDYEFVVGYNINVSDINLKTIETQVICALLHKNNGQINYRDFNLREGLDNLIYPTMLYTGGCHNALELGFVDLEPMSKEKETDPIKFGPTMWDQTNNKQVVYNSTVESGQNYSAGALYNNEPMKSLYNKLGMYTFFQPHAHAVKSNYETSVNIHMLDPNYDYFYINTSNDNSGKWTLVQHGAGEDPDFDTSFGRTPTWHLKNHPRYNMSVYTIEQYNNNYGVISTNYYSTMDTNPWGSECGDDNEPYYGTNLFRKNESREFHGMTAEALSEFYQKFAKTMSQVYAYNPDYTSITTYQGNSSINDKEVYAVSNVINEKSKFNLPNVPKDYECINDYIYINNLSITNYLNYLDVHSGASTYSDMGSLQFCPSFTYCGTSKDNPLLLTSLTYRFVPDHSVLLEVEPNIGGDYAVKHSDGSIDWINGSIRQDTLYGYSKNYHKLIPLQVGNYDINQEDGSLSVDTIHFDTNSLNMSNIGGKSNQAKALYEGTFTHEGLLYSLKGDNYKVLGYYNNYLILTNVDSTKDAIIDLALCREDDPSRSSDIKYFTAEYYTAHLKDSVGMGDSYNLDLSELNFKSLYYIATLPDHSNISLQDKSGLITPNVPISLVRTGYSGKKTLNKTVGSLGSSMEPQPLRMVKGQNRLMVVKIGQVNYYKDSSMSVKYISGDIMSTRSSYQYYTKKNDTTYIVNYPYAVLPHTSITLEDLCYEPLNPTHRLFFKHDLFWYPIGLDGCDGRVFYRSLPTDKPQLQNMYSGVVSFVDLGFSEAEAKKYIYPYGNWKSTNGGANEWQHNNMLFIHSGPCFMPESTKNTK